MLQAQLSPTAKGERSVTNPSRTPEHSEAARVLPGLGMTKQSAGLVGHQSQSPQLFTSLQEYQSRRNAPKGL